MSSDLITQEEIDHIKANPTILDIMATIKGEAPPIIAIRPYILKSGYYVSFSHDIIPDSQIVKHLSIGRKGIDTDPADTEIIAASILGPDYISFGTINLTDNPHFYSCEGKEDMIRLKHGLELMRFESGLRM